MRINGSGRKVIAVMVAAGALFAQNKPLPVKPATRSPVLDVRQIVDSSIAATQRHWEARLAYTYLERDHNRRRDPSGHVKSEDVAVTRTILVNGVPYEQLVERNGHPPTAEEMRRNKDKVDKLKRETPQQLAVRRQKQAAENLLIVREVPKAFDFKLLGEEVVRGRPAYVMQVTPRPGYHPQGKYGSVFSKVAGKMWVDKQDFGWVKVDGQVIQPFSIGLVLVRLLRGSQITMEQTRIDNGIWMPDRVEVRAEARIFLIKSLMIDRVLVYSEYMRADERSTASRR